MEMPTVLSAILSNTTTATTHSDDDDLWSQFRVDLDDTLLWSQFCINPEEYINTDKNDKVNNIFTTEKNSYIDDISSSMREMLDRVEKPAHSEELDVTDNNRNESDDVQMDIDDTVKDNETRTFRKSECNHDTTTNNNNKGVSDAMKNVHPNFDHQMKTNFDIKLTRSKLNCTICTMKNWSDECVALIANEFPEDTSDDEEYTPENDSNATCGKFNNDGDNNGDVNDKTLYSVAVDKDKNDANRNNNIDNVLDYHCDYVSDNNIEQNDVSHRTRSKLPLENTTIEHIEHSFLFPDITTDMYDTECDDTEWINFLKDLTAAPNDTMSDLVNDDPVNDPEYEIPVDEHENLEDYAEECRTDASVEIAEREYYYLIKKIRQPDVGCYTTLPHILSCRNNSITNDDEDDNANNNNTNDNSYSCSSSTNNYNNNNNNTVNYVMNTVNFTIALDNRNLVRSLMFTELQIDLVKQQIRQHIQLLVQDFIRCYRHPTLNNKLSGEVESLIKNLNLFWVDDVKHRFISIPINLVGATIFIDRWKAFADEQDESYFLRRRKKFDTQMMEMVCSAECVFVYPQLLLTEPYTPKQKRPVLSQSEDILITIGLKYFGEYLMEEYKSESINETELFRKSIALIYKHLVPLEGSTFFLEDYIKKCCTASTDNPIRYYYRNNRITDISSFLHPFTKINTLPLRYQPDDQLPMVWREYIYSRKYPNIRRLTRVNVERPILPKLTSSSTDVNLLALNRP